MSKHKTRNTASPASAAVLKAKSRRKILLTLAAGTALVIALAIFATQNSLLGAGSARATVPAPAQFQGNAPLAAERAFHDFGRISMAAGNVSHRYSIRNTGAAALTVTKIYTSCMCTVATLVTQDGRKGPFGMPGHGPMGTPDARLAAGEAAQVDVVFDPAAHGPAGVGLIDRTVTIVSDAGLALELRFNAMVTP